MQSSWKPFPRGGVRCDLLPQLIFNFVTSMKLHRLLAGVALAIQTCSLSAATEPIAAEVAKPPVYQRVNLAPQYEAVPGWPTRPPGVEWAAVAAIARLRPQLRIGGPYLGS